jgi:hypothetical protein
MEADYMDKRARAEGFEAGANGEEFDTFYLGRHVCKDQREAYRAGFRCGRGWEDE